MLDDVLKWLDEIIAAGMHSPDISAMILGNLSGFVLTLALERYFLPTVPEGDIKRRQQGYTFLFCWLVSSVASSMLWLAFDRLDPPFVRWTICITVSVLGFFFYPALARYLTTKFPSIGSAWEGGPKP